MQKTISSLQDDSDLNTSSSSDCHSNGTDSYSGVTESDNDTSSTSGESTSECGSEGDVSLVDVDFEFSDLTSDDLHSVKKMLLDITSILSFTNTDINRISESLCCPNSEFKGSTIRIIEDSTEDQSGGNTNKKGKPNAVEIEDLPISFMGMVSANLLPEFIRKISHLPMLFKCSSVTNFPHVLTPTLFMTFASNNMESPVDKFYLIVKTTRIAYSKGGNKRSKNQKSGYECMYFDDEILSELSSDAQDLPCTHRMEGRRLLTFSSSPSEIGKALEKKFV